MIAYDLQCVNGHSFEGWFVDEAAYVMQKGEGMIACPTCNATEVSRIPSVFAIKAASPSAASGAPPAAPVELSRRIIDYIEKNFDNVGCDFTKEALKMHYGVSEARNIRGTSTKEEEATLKKEGIEFFKIPMPTDRDKEV